MKRKGQWRFRQGGYALLDVVLAVALFGITVTGLISVMQRINETSTEFSRDRLIQDRLASLLAQTRGFSPSAMTTEVYDSDLDITFRTYAEVYEVENGEGAALPDLYLLTAEAAYRDDWGDQIEKAVLIIHQPDR